MPRDRSPYFTDKAQRQMEDYHKNQDEAFELLALIEAEFSSDPMSVQCFDLRVVQRVKECIEKRREFMKSSPFYYGA